MGREKRNEQRTEQFTKWIGEHRLLPAWKALSFAARDAYFHLQIRCFAESKSARNNNGEVFRSLRALAEDMGCSTKTAGAALADLQAKGWIVCTSGWTRGVDGKGRTAHFRLTMLPTSATPATREPRGWEEGEDYPILVYANYAPKPKSRRASNLSKKQNPPPYSDTPLCPNRAHLKVITA